MCQASGSPRRSGRLMLKRGHVQAGPGCQSCQEVHRRILLWIFLKYSNMLMMDALF